MGCLSIGANVHPLICTPPGEFAQRRQKPVADGSCNLIKGPNRSISILMLPPLRKYLSKKVRILLVTYVDAVWVGPADIDPV
jgi:hypothetical protein